MTKHQSARVILHFVRSHKTLRITLPWPLVSPPSFLAVQAACPIINDIGGNWPWTSAAVRQLSRSRLAQAPGDLHLTDSAVLVVEDETMILLDLESGLEEAGFKVVGVGSSAEALETFDADPASYKALISDIRLGQGKSGWEVARHLRQANPTLPVVYISGDSAIHWGAEGVPESVMITKPFVMAQIITALSTLLNQQSPMSPPAQS